MKPTAEITVSPQEVDGRLREYREKGAQQRVIPQIIYRPPYVLCPWPNCHHSIAGIDFQLELMGDQALYEQLISAWWKGGGLVGRCPGCGNHVLASTESENTRQSLLAPGPIAADNPTAASWNGHTPQSLKGLPWMDRSWTIFRTTRFVS
jgi:hypothetical protein